MNSHVLKPIPLLIVNHRKKLQIIHILLNFFLTIHIVKLQPSPLVLKYDHHVGTSLFVLPSKYMWHELCITKIKWNCGDTWPRKKVVLKYMYNVVIVMSKTTFFSLQVYLRPIIKIDLIQSTITKIPIMFERPLREPKS